MLSVITYQGTTPRQNNLKFLPLWWSFHREGGPEMATITATGSESDLWGVLGWLGSAIEITDGAHPTWWGYLDTVTINLPGLSVGLSLQNMYNVVRVTYSYVPDGVATVGTRKDTATVTDADSVAQYGTRALYASIDGASDAQAEQTRDTLLALYRHPVADIRTGGTGEAVTVTLECRGWWDTLGWLYYANTGTASTVTTAQIAAILTDYNGTNGWLSGSDILDASGVSSSQYRAGDMTHLEEIRALLRTGTTNDVELQATITPDLALRVEEQPSSTDVRYYLRRDGALLDRHGTPLAGGACPAGEWCGLWDVRGNPAATAFLGNASQFLIQRCEFDAERKTYTVEPVGLPSPWEVARST